MARDIDKDLEAIRILVRAIMMGEPEGDVDIDDAFDLAGNFRDLDRHLSRGGRRPSAWEPRKRKERT